MKGKTRRAIPLLVIGAVLASVVSLNAAAGTNKVYYEIRGSSSERSPIGKSNQEETITITCDYTTTNYLTGQTVGYAKFDGDQGTPYKETRISLEWWTDGSIISTREANITLYEGQIGWQFATVRDSKFLLSSSIYTTDNTYRGKNSHWTFKNSNADDGIYLKFGATLTNWSTN
ncbi:MAG TPA: hypothetical protein H9684_03530 [Firmicutes bacterium]|nr:hypothetical protein [Bacillota bacterium]